MTTTWFISGASRGFGKEFATSALQRGDRVAATARSIADLAPLADEFGDAIVPLQLDVTDRDAVFATVTDAHAQLGHLDVIVNNAGYGLFGAVEEITPEQLRDQLEVNLFGVLNVTQAVLPILRGQGAGRIIQISTVGGVVAFPTLGGYHASKWALEGLSESLAQEVAPFGISVTLVEPGGFATDWAGSSAVHATPQPQYDGLHTAMAQQSANTPPEMIGNPVTAGQAILALADAENPPLRVFFGSFPTMIVPGIYQARLDTWQQWNDLALQAHGN